jgi:hypothetical protein
MDFPDAEEIRRRPAGQRRSIAARNHGSAGVGSSEATLLPHYDCRRLYGGIAYFRAAELMMPRSGPKVFSPKTPAGTYFVMSATNANNRSLSWDVKVDLKPETHSVELSERNKEPVQ